MDDPSDIGRRVLSHLLLAPDAYLFGTRDGDTPFALVDAAAKRSNEPEWLNPLPRAVVMELLAAGLIRDDTDTNESVNLRFRISVRGRARAAPR